MAILGRSFPQQPIINRLRIPTAAPMIVPVNQITETDTAQSITRIKRLAIGQALETDASQTTTRLRSWIIGQATTTSTAQPITRLKTKVIGQATGLPADVNNTFEGGTNSTAITTGNSGGASGTAFTNIGLGSGATATYLATSAYQGTMGARMATTATSTTAQLDYNSTVLGYYTFGSSVYGRFYLRLPSLPATDTRVAVVSGPTNAFGGEWRINSSGQLELRAGVGTLLATSTNTVTANTWFRLEVAVLVISDTVGQLEAKLFLNPDAAVSAATETLTSAATIDTLPSDGSIAQYRCGIGRGVSNYTTDVDGVSWSTNGYIGPTSLARTEKSQPIVRVHSRVLGQPVETDNSRAITRPGTFVPISQATETDTSQAVSRSKLRIVNVSTETDVSQAITRVKLRAIGQTTSTQTAQSITRVRSRVLGQATETSISNAITKQKLKIIGQSTTTLVAQPITRVKSKALGQVLETDTAQVVIRKSGLGQATETDIAQALGRNKTKVIQTGEYHDEYGDDYYDKGEVDLAQLLIGIKTKSFAQPLETDVSGAITRVKSILLGRAFTVHLADSITAKKTRILGQATETNVSQATIESKTKTLVQAVESDTSQATNHRKLKVLGQSTETDIAQAIVSGVRTGTQLHLTTIAAESGVTVGAGTRHRFHWDAGNSAVIRNKNTVAGPTAPLQVTDSSTTGTDGSLVSWYSNQLEAVTIAGAITIELWAEESG